MRLTRRDLCWGFGAQGLSIGLWVVLLPLVLRFLPPAQVGLWLIFNTIAGLAQLLDLGFQPTLARNVSYVYAGAQDLLPTGMGSPATGELSRDLLAALLGGARRIYRLITLASVAVLWLGGTLYLHTILPQGQDPLTTTLAWLAFSGGSIVNMYYGYLNAFLQGRGDMVQANKVVAITRMAQLLLSVGCLLAGRGLLGLGIASLAATILSRILAHHYVFAASRPEMHARRTTREERKRITSVVWHNSSRYGLVLVGAFMITRANTLIAASRVGVVESAGYALALQIMIVLQSLAVLPFNLCLPELNRLRSLGQKEESRSLLSTSVATVLGLFILGALVFLTLGPVVLHRLGKGTNLPSLPILGALALIFLLEMNHGLCANFIATGNEVPFVRAALLTGACILLSSWVLARPFGIPGLVASMGICQLAYNNWKWPRETAKLLDMGYLNIVFNGFRRLRSARG